MKTVCRKALFLLLVAVLAASMVAGCGKKGDPMARGVKPEAAVSGLRVDRADEGFAIQWPVRENQRGETVFKLEKSDLDPEGGECPGCPRTFSTLVEMAGNDKACTTGKIRECRYRDNDVKSGHLYIYRLSTCDRSGRCGDVANSTEVKF